MTQRAMTAKMGGLIGLGIAVLLQGGDAKALTQTTPWVPFAAYNNANPSGSSSGTSSNLSLSKFNVANSTLNSIKFLFSGPTPGGATGGVISGDYTFGQALGQPTIVNNSTVSVSGVTTQLQFFFNSNALQVNGPIIGVTPSSSSFIKTATTNSKTVSITGGDYTGSSSASTDAALLAFFTGSGTATTSKFQAVWNSTLNCVTSTGASCTSRTGIGFNTQVGEQTDIETAPSSLVGGGNAWVAVQYDYTLNPTPPGPSPSSAVPAPAPILGAASAFAFARKTRQRIKLSKVAA